MAALVGRGVHGRGALVETSLFEAMIDFQFEVLTTHLNDGHQPPERSAVNGAHAYLGAPYGNFETADGYLALAMTPSLRRLCELLYIEGLKQFYDDKKALMRERDQIKSVIAKRLSTGTTSDWLAVLQPADIWCSEVLDWAQMRNSEAYQIMDFEQQITRNGTVNLNAVRCPIRINQAKLNSPNAAPSLGQDNTKIWPDRSN